MSYFLDDEGYITNEKGEVISWVGFKNEEDNKDINYAELAKCIQISCTKLEEIEKNHKRHKPNRRQRVKNRREKLNP
jgi:hypothetical protein